MHKIEPVLLQHLRKLLGSCLPHTYDEIHALFVDARIAPWSDLIPSGISRAAIILTIISTLGDQSNLEGENALVLFLYTLADYTPDGAQAKRELRELANALEVYFDQETGTADIGVSIGRKASPWKKGQIPLCDIVRQQAPHLEEILMGVWQRCKAGPNTVRSRAIAQHLAALIPDEQKGQTFNAVELFILSAAAALQGQEPQDDPQRAQPKLVQNHALNIVLCRLLDVYHAPERITRIVPVIPVGAVEVRVSLLAALLCLARELATDCGGCLPQDLPGAFDEEPPPSQEVRPLPLSGWTCNNESTIILHAQPQEWADIEKLHSHIAMLQHRLAPVTAILQDAGFPYILDIEIDTTLLEDRAVQQQSVTRQIKRAFLGMDHFTEEDATAFKGRDREIEALFRFVMAHRVAIMIGDLGVGKTSLIRAGLVPRLEQAQWYTLYTRPLDNPDRYIACDIRTMLADAGMHPLPASGGASLLDSFAYLDNVLHNTHGAKGRALIVLDQFEDIGRLLQSTRLAGLHKALVAVQAGRFWHLRVLISYRADAEAGVGPWLQKIAGTGQGLPRQYLDPLTQDGARAALETGFAQAQIGIPAPDMLDAIVLDLSHQPPVAGGLVYPPYLQIVGQTLSYIAREEQDSVLTMDRWQSLSGCGTLIGNYLAEQLQQFGAQKNQVRQVLGELVRSTGVKGQRALDELAMAVGQPASEIKELLDVMVQRRMVRPLGGEVYEIIHDYLAELISMDLSPEERELKMRREILELKAQDYPRTQELLTPTELVRLYAIQDQIYPSEVEQKLLLHSNLAEHGPAWYWLRELPHATLIRWLREGLKHPSATLQHRCRLVLAHIIEVEALPQLRTWLKDNISSVRQVAVQALAQLGDKESLPELRALLKDSNADVRQVVAETLAQLGDREALPQLRALLKDRNSNVQIAAIKTLAQLNDWEALPELCALLDNDKVWYTAVEALVQLGDREIWSTQSMLRGFEEPHRSSRVWELARLANCEVLYAMLNDDNWRVRCATVESLAQLGNHKILPALRARLNDDNSYVREAAIKTLAQLKDYEALPELCVLLPVLLAHHDERMRKTVIEVLTQLRDHGVLPELRALLKDDSNLMRETAVEILAQLQDREALPELRALLKDDTYFVRVSAVEALAQLGDHEALPRLRAMLNDSDRYVRVAAAKALAQLGDHKALPELRALLEDCELYSRADVVRALVQLRDREAIPKLIAMINNEHPWHDGQGWTAAIHALVQLGEVEVLLKHDESSVREIAVQALAQLGNYEALPEIRMLLQDRSSSVRLAAMEALIQLGDCKALPEMLTLFNDDDWLVQKVVGTAFVTLGDKEALPMLINLIDASPMSKIAEKVTATLIALDRKLFSPEAIAWDEDNNKR